MRTRRTKEQIRKDIYNREVDAYNFYVVNLETMRAETGFEFKEDAVDLLNDYDDKKKYKVVSKRALKSMGIENPNESFKYQNGGDFQAGVYAGGGGVNRFSEYSNDALNDMIINLSRYKNTDSEIQMVKDELKKRRKFEFGGDFQFGVYARGGSLQAHGIKEGDTFMKTISGNIQKVKDKNGKIVYVDLSNGKRDTQPPLPFNNGGMVSEDLFENYNKQPKKLAEIVDFYMAKYDEGEMDYQDTKNFLKEVEAIGYTFDYGLDNEPYGLRPIGTKLKEYDEGGEVTYFLNKDGIKVRSKVEPKRKLTEAEWMAKHNESKEARTYGFGGLFSKSSMMSRPKPIDLNQEQVRLKSGEYVQVLSQQGDTLMVMNLSKLGTGTAPKYAKLSDVDMTSFATGGALIGNQKRIDMNKNGKIDAEDFKLLRSSMNGAWRNERKHVNHNEDYEVRYARKKPSRTGYKGKRMFGEGGGISNLDFRNFTLDELINNLPQDVDFMWINKANTKDYVRRYSTEFKKYSNKKFTITDSGKMELSKGSENMYLDIMVFESSNDAPEIEYIISIYTKDNHKGLKLFANNLVEKFATGGAVFKNRVKPTSQKMSSGAEVKKTNRGGVMVLAKKIRKDGESWKDALKRAGQQLK
jgi:hypothetical protein